MGVDLAGRLNGAAGIVVWNIYFLEEFIGGFHSLRNLRNYWPSAEVPVVLHRKKPFGLPR